MNDQDRDTGIHTKFELELWQLAYKAATERKLTDPNYNGLDPCTEAFVRVSAYRGSSVTYKGLAGRALEMRSAAVTADYHRSFK